MTLQVERWIRSGLLVGVCAIVSLSASFAEQSVAQSKHLEQSWKPPKGFVPTAEVAVKIAEAVLVPIYGADSIKRQQPLVASLSENVWTVKGTFEYDGRRGGVAKLKLSKIDGRIISVTHGK